jgi:hypothetical protein
VARDLVTSAFRQSRVQRVRVLCHSYISKPRTPKRRKRPKSGPQYQEQSQPSIQRDTWCAIRLLAFSPIAISKAQGAAPSYSRCARCRERPGPRPTASPSEFRTVRSEKDAWRPIKPSRRFAHRDYDKQGLAPSYSRTPKAPLRINAGSQPVVTWEIKELCKRGQRHRV